MIYFFTTLTITRLAWFYFYRIQWNMYRRRVRYFIHLPHVYLTIPKWFIWFRSRWIFAIISGTLLLFYFVFSILHELQKVFDHFYGHKFYPNLYYEKLIKYAYVEVVINLWISAAWSFEISSLKLFMLLLIVLFLPVYKSYII